MRGRGGGQRLAGRGALAVVAVAIALLAGSLFLDNANGQERRERSPFLEEEIETDRDSFTPATSTVDPRRALVELSHSFIDVRSGTDGHSYPELLTRYGLGRRLELRVGWNFETGRGGEVSGSGLSEGDESGEDAARMLYGFKYLVSNQAGWLPQSSLIVQGFAPTQGPESRSQMSLGGVCGWRLPGGWLWDSALRYDTAREAADNFGELAPSTVLKAPLGERWNAHLEYFGIFSTGRAEDRDRHYVSFGPHVLLTPNVEFGTRVGFGLSDDAARFFSNVGLGVRF